MEAISMLKVSFPSYTGSPRCQPNGALSGAVMVKCEESVNLQQLNVTVRGREKVAVSLNTPATAYCVDDLRTVSRPYFQLEKPILSPEDRQGPLAPGLHLFHFICHFPNVNYPPTTRDMFFSVDYFCGATLTTSDREYQATEVPIVFEALIEPSSASTFRQGSPPANTVKVRDNGSSAKPVLALHNQFSQPSYLPGDTVVISLGLDPLINLNSIRKLEYRVIETCNCHYKGDWAAQSKVSQSDVSDLNGQCEVPLWTRERTVHPFQSATLSRNTSPVYPANRYLGDIQFLLPKATRALSYAYLQFSYGIEIIVTYWSGLRTNRTASAFIPINVVGERPEPSLNPLQSQGSAGPYLESTATSNLSVRSSVQSISSADSISTPSTLGAGYVSRRRKTSFPHIFNPHQDGNLAALPDIEPINM
ncbi:hypothetical protein IWQ60_004113 [Tieghemiomyces parasiticus]|uniref:Arrestin-like N-terminal domain-containing protein n=1 Tax=Tieghemiomyces parasiticus TaxID=78921 RepID=A0A9W8AGS0_9FUNG|nr:hypothetical protein IWQ60_004113 [Tieghemiomyces parasiticus]